MTAVVFVILHYIAYKETINAVSHIIKNCDTDQYQIIILLNNDVNILDRQLYAKLTKEYRRSGFALVGAKNVRAGDENSQRFLAWARAFPNIASSRYYIKDMRERIFWNRFGLYEKVYPFLHHKIYDRLKIFQPPAVPLAGVEENVQDASSGESKWYDVMIQGCFLVFSRRYIDRFDGMDERTFFYGEEPILFIRVIAAGMHTVYLPELHIEHIGKVSTNTAVEKKVLRKKSYDFFAREKLSNEFLLEDLLKFKTENGLELYEWWERYGKLTIEERRTDNGTLEKNLSENGAC